MIIILTMNTTTGAKKIKSEITPAAHDQLGVTERKKTLIERRMSFFLTGKGP
jgi:hypothetical protein